MPIASGSRLGPYEIIALLGSGGMGEVYRARDPRLGRDVAIKVLPEIFTADPERLARFEREARQAVGVGSHGQLRKAGPLPVAQALSIAQQIADALDAAHEKGIVHRDLKPANIKITSVGVVKVLDFGLAKALDSLSPGGGKEWCEGAGLSQLPTVTAGGTREGTILGTAAYMSPEQARGKSVDKRTDIWAFGCLLYEMLAGRVAFAGETVSDTIAAILEREPDWGTLPQATPNSIRRLLERCLEKDPKRRLRDIGDARIDIDNVLSSSSRPQSALAATGTRVLRLWRTAAILSLTALLVIGGTLIAWSLRRARSAAATIGAARITVAQLTSYGGRQSVAALAPDGRSFVFVSDHTGSPDIWLRQVSGGEPVRLTNDAFDEGDLAFAADGESVYFTRVEESGEAIWQIGSLGGKLGK